MKVFETLGSLKLIREKLVSISSLTNHRPATENFSLINLSDPSVSTIFTLGDLWVVHNHRILVKEKIGHSDSPTAVMSAANDSSAKLHNYGEDTY